MAGRKNGKEPQRALHQTLKRAAQLANHIYMGEAGKLGLTQRQFALLAAVDRNDGASQTEFCRATGIDRSTLADLVARMMAQGLLQRRRDKDDGRSNTVRITAQGKKMLKSAQPGAEEVDRLLLAKLSPSLRKPFQEALDVLAGQMDQLEADQPKEPPSRIRTRRPSRAQRPA